jgi:hypothetical protein
MRGPKALVDMITRKTLGKHKPQTTMLGRLGMEGVKVLRLIACSQVP